MVALGAVLTKLALESNVVITFVFVLVLELGLGVCVSRAFDEKTCLSLCSLLSGLVFLDLEST